MPNVVRGDRSAGLMAYLVGPGRSNEHTDPHLVAGDWSLMAWHDDDELSRDSALAIARHLDRPMKTFGVQVKGGHVWHCSLSLRAEEGQLTDEKWGEIARRFVGEMGFDDGTERAGFDGADGVTGGRASCPWVAVRHGLSGGGNDHIHIAVNLVRYDGTKASTHLDWPRAQKIARVLEVDFGLEQLESAGTDRSTRGYHPAERVAQARARAQARHERETARLTSGVASGVAWSTLPQAERDARVAAELAAEQPRRALARIVRGCATASRDEAEFVRRLRRAGALVRPRFADGRDDVVTGYAVAARPQVGERPIWYGGGHLGRDLALPRLRQQWLDTPAGASDAAAEWVAARRGRRVATVGREAGEVDPRLWQRVIDDAARLREQLRTVPLEDTDLWARVARETAGAFAAWSNQVEVAPGPLAAAADALATSAQTKHRPTHPEPAARVSLASAAVLLMSAASGDQVTLAQAALLRQLLNLSKAVHDAHVSEGQARRAAEISHAIRVELAAVREQMPALVTVGAQHVPGPDAGPSSPSSSMGSVGDVRGGEGSELQEMVRRATGAVAPATGIIAPDGPLPSPIPPRFPDAVPGRQKGESRTGRPGPGSGSRGAGAASTGAER